ncbi:class I SAM-dependent methyltransferase [Halobacillus sp. A1]|uniref:class I SAM-dependent methyltransferase n=1 Tax=Halobacillus sp. A1 TaxID=2880262 RepID=UPI0020A67F6D|nr:methyltransferase domain-containing protein [Halobacillus sp. A1]MCP3033293.1 class I SAM-dependent methyltransferase [Halobacillus sp. A1]
METVSHNSKAWDKKVEEGVTYTKAVSGEEVAESKKGNWSISVTTKRAVPRDWFPDDLKGLRILCLASGGGQQAPILAAAGAAVTVVDLSEKQLEQDRMVAERENLKIETLKAEMSDLSKLNDEMFDIIVHPVSNVFVENVLPVWKEASRVLKTNGTMIAGFTNPLLYLFDDEQEEKGVLDVKYSIPFSSKNHLSKDALLKLEENNEALEFGHSLEDQIQGQIDAGFALTGFYEDDFGGIRLIDQYIKCFMATKAVKVKNSRL